MRNKISAPVPWRKNIEGWTDTLRAAGLSAQTIKSRRYKMVHLAALLMSSGPEDVTTEHYVAMPDGRLREATAAVRLDV